MIKKKALYVNRYIHEQNCGRGRGRGRGEARADEGSGAMFLKVLPSKPPKLSRFGEAPAAQYFRDRSSTLLQTHAPHLVSSPSNKNRARISGLGSKTSALIFNLYISILIIYKNTQLIAHLEIRYDRSSSILLIIVSIIEQISFREKKNPN